MKTVIFCGASSGLGKIAALYFLEKGWKVINVDIATDKDLEQKGIQTVYCDLAIYEESKKAFHEIFENNSNISALINCIRHRKQDKEIGWDKELRIDLTTYYHASSLVAEYMKHRPEGCSILSFSSVTASLVTLHEDITYHVAKSGISQMMRYFAVQYGPYGIRANSIVPGLISREGTEQSSDDPNASLYSKLAQYVPLRRSGSPKEVAELLFFLSSDQSTFISGQNICIDGGLSVREQIDCIWSAYEY